MRVKDLRFVEDGASKDAGPGLQVIDLLGLLAQIKLLLVLQHLVVVGVVL